MPFDSTEFRENMCKKFQIFFVNENDAINLEKAIYNWTVKESTTKKVVKKWSNSFFQLLYVNHARSIYINLKNNPKLVEMANEKKIKPQDIPFMTHQEMLPEKWNDMIKAKSIRDMNKYEQKMEANTDRFTCRYCHSKNCTYILVQTRSADEPMTIIIDCLDCGKRMKK